MALQFHDNYDAHADLKSALATFRDQKRFQRCLTSEHHSRLWSRWGFQQGEVKHFPAFLRIMDEGWGPFAVAAVYDRAIFGESIEAPAVFRMLYL